MKIKLTRRGHQPISWESEGRVLVSPEGSFVIITELTKDEKGNKRVTMVPQEDVYELEIKE